MVKYLSMDGVDDKLKTPSMTFKTVELDISIDPITTRWQYYVDARSGIAFYAYRNSNGTDGTTGNPNLVYVDGVQKTNNTTWVPSNQRVKLSVSAWAEGTDDAMIFAQNNGNQEFMKGKIYGVKFFNATGTLVAHYDMNTGTVQDQSGNGNHATLTGGTWLDDGTGGTDTGTDGSTLFDVKQVIYQDSALTSDTRQTIYADETLTTDLLQRIYSDEYTSSDIKQAIYSDGYTQVDMKQIAYHDGATTVDTSQVIYEVSTLAFDMLQTYFEDGQTGATPFDMRIVYYADGSTSIDTKQAWYEESLTRYDVAQFIYETSSTVTDMRAVIYADGTIGSDTKQALYTDGSFSADTLQQLLSEWAEYREVIRITLEITQRQRNTLEIVQRQTIELNL